MSVFGIDEEKAVFGNRRQPSRRAVHDRPPERGRQVWPRMSVFEIMSRRSTLEATLPMSVFGIVRREAIRLRRRARIGPAKPRVSIGRSLTPAAHKSHLPVMGIYAGDGHLCR
jgi:hypothetical protein